MDTTPLRQFLKRAAVSTGTYRLARFFKRYLVDRWELHRHQEEIARYRALIPAGALCFDVGANFGAKSEAMLLAGAKVVAFEPHLGAAREAQVRCARWTELQLVPAAIAARSGIAMLYTPENADESSLVPDWVGDRPTRGLPVPTITLADAIRDLGRPHYCKIDVEGFEYEVLCTLSVPIPVVSFEYHVHPARIEVAKKCLDHLERLGAYAANLTLGEEPGWLQPDWEPLASVRRKLDSFVSSPPPRHYGDIYVRSEAKP